MPVHHPIRTPGEQQVTPRYAQGPVEVECQMLGGTVRGELVFNSYFGMGVLIELDAHLGLLSK